MVLDLQLWRIKCFKMGKYFDVYTVTLVPKICYNVLIKLYTFGGTEIQPIWCAAQSTTKQDEKEGI